MPRPRSISSRHVYPTVNLKRTEFEAKLIELFGCVAVNQSGRIHDTWPYDVFFRIIEWTYFCPKALKSAFLSTEMVGILIRGPGERPSHKR